MTTNKATLIISVYDNVTALRAVLDSLAMQTEQAFEIIISEDGEHEAMRKFCASYPFGNDHQHLTQPDIGWRKNRALNSAIRAARSNWLIFIDGDCVLHPRFIEQHLRLAAPTHIVAGKRVKMNVTMSRKLQTATEPTIHRLNRYLLRCLLTGRHQGNTFVEEGIFINPDSFGGWIPRLRKMHQLKGCNMSFSKAAIEAINGFDEAYIRPAIGEDIDLTWRFQAAGYKLVSARNMAVQYHLYHRENWHDQQENIRLMEQKQQKNEYVCLHGLKQVTYE